MDEKANESTLFLSGVSITRTLHIYEYGLLKLDVIDAARSKRNVYSGTIMHIHSFIITRNFLL